MRRTSLLAAVMISVTGLWIVGCRIAEEDKLPTSTPSETPAQTDPSATEPAATETPTENATTPTNTSAQGSSKVPSEKWGEADGKEVFVYTLKNASGASVKLTNWGALVTEAHVPDKDGNLADVVLGYGSLEKYLNSDGENTNPSYFGATIGRCANRIGGAQFEIDGKTYTLAKNNEPNTLHGGDKGWDKLVWDGVEVAHDKGPAVKFTLTSADGDEGYPGEVKAEVTYAFSDKNELWIEMTATTDAPTHVNMTNHSYFNLKGQGEGTILDHTLFLKADRYTPANDTFVPTGELAPVADTPFDFTKAAVIGSRIDQVGGDPGGYDLNYVVRDAQSDQAELVAVVEESTTGRTLEVYSTEVGIQFYTGNFLDGTLVGKEGKKYEKNFAFCLEPQFHPDTPNQPNFPSSLLKPGENYRHVTIYKFGVKSDS